jgi:hypothetical protein
VKKGACGHETVDDEKSRAINLRFLDHASPENGTLSVDRQNSVWAFLLLSRMMCYDYALTPADSLFATESPKRIFPCEKPLPSACPKR